MESREARPSLHLVWKNDQPTSPVYRGGLDLKTQADNHEADVFEAMLGEPFVRRATWESAKVGLGDTVSILIKQQEEVFSVTAESE